MMPASRMASIRSEVATGRRMNGRDGVMRGSSSMRRAGRGGSSAPALAAAALIARRLVCGGRPLPLLWRCRLSRTPRGGIDELYLRAVAQLIGAIDHDEVPGLDPALHFGVLALGCAELDGSHGHGLILPNQEHEGSRRAALDRRARSQRHVLPRLDSHAHIDELIGKKSRVLIGKFGFELDRSRCRIDLIVDRQKTARCEFVLAAAVERFYGDVLSALHALEDARNVVLRNRIDD